MPEHGGFLGVRLEVSDRTVRPLGCFNGGKVWMLAAWCETRDGFGSLRLDRMVRVQRLGGLAGQFKDEPGQAPADRPRAPAPPDVRGALTR